MHEVEAPVLFLNEEDGRGHGRFGWAYALTLEVLIEELVQLLLLNRCQRVDLSAEHLCVRDEFDGMVPFLPIWEFVKGLLGTDVFELLVRLRYYILKVCHAGPFCGFHEPLGDHLSGLDFFRVLTNEAYKELVTSVQIVRIWMCEALWWLSLVRF